MFSSAWKLVVCRMTLPAQPKSKISRIEEKLTFEKGNSPHRGANNRILLLNAVTKKNLCVKSSEHCLDIETFKNKYCFNDSFQMTQSYDIFA